MASTDNEGGDVTGGGEPESTAESAHAEAPGEPAAVGGHHVPASAPLPREVDQRLSELFGRSPDGETGQDAEATPGPPQSESYWSRHTVPASVPPASAPPQPPPPPPPAFGAPRPGPSATPLPYSPYGLRPPAPTPPPPPRRKATHTFALVLAAAVLLLVGTGVAVFALNGNGTNPTNAVETAVENLHRAKTAQIALALSVAANGQVVRITGNGETNVLTNATNETINYNVGGSSFSARAIIDGSTAFFNYGAEVGRVDPGKSWVSMNVGQAGASGSESTGIYSDPNAMVAVLGSPDTVVRALGGSDVNGLSVQGYTIELGRTGIAHILASTSYPSSLKNELSTTQFSRLDYTAFVDDSNRLSDVRTVANYSVEGVHFTAHGDMALSDYGVHVAISDPPANEVVPLQEFEKIAAQSQGTATS